MFRHTLRAALLLAALALPCAAQDPAAPDTARPDTARPDTARPDPARPDPARDAFRLGVGVGTSGLTIEPQWRTPFGAVRGTAGFGTFSLSERFDGTDYDALVTLGTVGVLFDVFPARNGLRVTLGAVASLDRADLTGIAPALSIGGTTYSGVVIDGTVRHQRKVQPVLAVGYASNRRNWSVDIDVGARFAGGWEVDLRNSPGSSVTIPDTDLAAEAQAIEAELSDLDILPYVKLGVSFRF